MNKTVFIDYTNWGGDRQTRQIAVEEIFYGKTQWYPTEQWLLKATDVKNKEEMIFPMQSINVWREPFPKEDTTEPLRFSDLLWLDNHMHEKMLEDVCGTERCQILKDLLHGRRPITALARKMSNIELKTMKEYVAMYSDTKSVDSAWQPNPTLSELLEIEDLFCRKTCIEAGLPECVYGRFLNEDGYSVYFFNGVDPGNQRKLLSWFKKNKK